MAVDNLFFHKILHLGFADPKTQHMVAIEERKLICSVNVY